MHCYLCQKNKAPEEWSQHLQAIMVSPLHSDSTLLISTALFSYPKTLPPPRSPQLATLRLDTRFWSTDCLETETYARSYAEQHGMHYISPYNNLHVVGGQGTIGIELSEQVKQIDVVLVAVGGGGMISGIAGYVKTLFPRAEMIGCSPTHSPVMAKSVQAGQILEMESLPTLSDGTAGGIEKDSITFPLCQRLVDDYILVSEEEIRQAMRLFIETHHMLIEGAAGVPLAALLKMPERFQGKTVVIVLCGANISLETFEICNIIKYDASSLC